MPNRRALVVAVTLLLASPLIGSAQAPPPKEGAPKQELTAEQRAVYMEMRQKMDAVRKECMEKMRAVRQEFEPKMKAVGLPMPGDGRGPRPGGPDGPKPGPR